MFTDRRGDLNRVEKELWTPMPRPLFVSPIFIVLLIASAAASKGSHVQRPFEDARVTNKSQSEDLG